MFRLDQRTLQSRLSGDGGAPFTYFVDGLIQMEAFIGGVSMDQFHRQLRVNIGDGGVDTSLDVSIDSSTLGWFTAPTCWQYKAESTYETASLIAEIKREMNKSHSTKLIQASFGYRFCILADIPDNATSKIEAAMETFANEICNNHSMTPQKPRLVDGADLQNWAELRPSAVLSLTGQGGEYLSLPTWISNTRDLTPQYVANPASDEMAERIRLHVNFQRPISGSDVCLTITGYSGVGKTRFVAETLDAIAGIGPLVVQTANDQQARQLAARASEDPRVKMILVADECSVEAVLTLQGLVAASSNRIRIVAIEHLGSNAVYRASQPESWLSKLPLPVTNDILRENFPGVPDEVRGRIVRLSDGYIRFAALICQNQAGLDLGDLTQSIGSVNQWIDRYLNDMVDCDVVGAIALFSRVGFRDEVRDELQMLSTITRLTVREIERRVDKIRTKTGFVTQQGQYWYVTPELVAPEMFRRGWRAFAENDLDGFVKSLSPEMLEQFKRRVDFYGGEEVAARVADYFQDLMSTLTISDLSDADIAEFVVSVTKLDPSRHVQRLAELIERSTADEIQAIGTSPGSGSWGARRYLVWMFEKFALFPEFFREAERALYKLALNETEEHIGNNATNVWAQLWQIHFSNTSLSFSERLSIVQHRFYEQMPVELCELSIDAMVGRSGGGPVPPDFYAGRRVPDTWSPETLDEERACLGEAVRFAADVMQEVPRFDDIVLDVLLRNIIWLVDRGVVDDFRDSLSGDVLSGNRKIKVYNALLELDRRHFARGVQDNQPAVNTVRQWIAEIQPREYSEQLRSLCTSDIWGERFLPENEGNPGEIDDLVQYAIENPDALINDLSWLSTNEATAARRFGVKLGQADQTCRFADAIVEALTEESSLQFFAGYLSSIIKHTDPLPRSVYDFVSGEIAKSPRDAMELIEVAGDHVGAFASVIAAVRNDDLKAADVIRLAYNFGGSPLPSEEVEQLLNAFIESSTRLDREASCLVRLIHHFSMATRTQETEPGLFNSVRIRFIVFQVISIAVNGPDRHAIRELCQLVSKLIQAGELDGFDLLHRALCSNDLTLCRKSLDTLEELATDFPVDVMRCFGSALTSESNLYLRVHVCDSLLASLPNDVVLDWCRDKPAQTIRVLARHIPPPYRSDNAIKVPDLLNEFLTIFGSDEVLAELHAGKNSTGIWTGPLSPQLREEADSLTALLNHANPWIRKYAAAEREYLTDWAKREQLHEENESIEFRSK